MTDSSRPDGPRYTASRVQDSLRLGGLVIALVQGAVLPLLGLPPSLPAIALAGTMMGVGQAIRISRERRGGSSDS